MENIKFSLWWMPNPDTVAFKTTQSTIDQLAEEYQTPRFDTHITLISDVVGSEAEIIAASELLAQKITPFEVTLEGIDYVEEEMYQSLAVRVGASDQILSANRQARWQFERSQGRKFYVPHISLRYVENPTEAEALEIIDEIGNPFKGLTFIADRIHVFTSIPGIEGITQWKRVAEIPLKGSNG